MSTSITINLDTLTEEKAGRLCGLLIAYVNPVLEEETVSDTGPVLTVPEQPNATPPTYDKTGIPWDARIHASSKGLNSDGTWRAKRGVDEATVTTVTAELNKLMTIPVPVVPLAPPPPPAPPDPIVTPATPTLIEDKKMRDNFISLFGRVSAAIATGRLTDEQLNKCLIAIGVTSLPLLGARLDLVPSAAQLIDAVIAGQSA